MGSAFIPSTFTKATASSAEPLPTSPQASASCEACRISGTVTFAAVGTYALTFARSQAKTRVGKSAASIAGLGKQLPARPLARSAGRGKGELTDQSGRCAGFLAAAAARWTVKDVSFGQQETA